MVGDKVKDKIIKNILIVIIIIIAVVGITYAYITWTSDRMNTTGNSECFEVFYSKGTDIGSDQNMSILMPTDDYTGGLSTTVKMGFSNACTNVNGKGIIVLNTLDTTSTNLFREGLLNYAVLKNDTKITEGSITSIEPIEIDVGTLKKVDDVQAADSYTIYVWINNKLVSNDDYDSNYNGNINVRVEQQAD